MKRLGLGILVVLILAVAAFPFTLQAQDDMMDTHVCDSTLITLLLVAEGDYGFHSMYDVSTYEKGQFAPLFEEMMMGMEDDMGDDEMMDDSDMGDDEMMDDEDMGDDMMDMVMLTPVLLMAKMKPVQLYVKN